jgi:protein-glucosylgalactosylhydroxylysine glucosidase
MSTVSNNTVISEYIIANQVQANELSSEFLTTSLLTVEAITFTNNVPIVNRDNNWGCPDVPPHSNNGPIIINYTSTDTWNLSYEIESSPKNFFWDDKYSGMLVANGKIGVVTSFDRIDVQKAFIATDLRYANGAYRPNVVQPFYVNNVKFFNNADEKTIVHTTNQGIDYYGGVFTSGFTIQDKESETSIKADMDLFALKNAPFSMMHTFNVVVGSNITELPIYHEVYCKDNIMHAEYNNNVIYNERVNADRGLYVLSGKGTLSDSGKQIVFASCYMFDDAIVDKVDNLGFNVYRNNERRCYNKFRVNGLREGDIVKFHVLSTCMTEFDFDTPLEEVKRIVLTMAYRGATYSQSASRIRSDHTLSWNDTWTTQIGITPKFGLTNEMENKVNNWNRLIKSSMYHIFASTRENVSLDVNPLSLSVIDKDGTVLYDGDMWLVPLLLFIKPDIARSMLEFRFKTLGMAQQLAAGYGYQGAKFPYVDDAIGYKNTMYWDVLSPMHVFNSALIAINTWNYYRITRDREWLSTKGYSMLKGIADFFVSLIQRDEDGTYHLRNVVGLGEKASVDNNSFTNNLVKTALRYAIEASYELSYYIREDWRECYHGLPILYIDQVSNCDIVKFDEAASETQKYSVLETLFVLMPYFSQVFFCGECGRGPLAIKRNLDYYESRVEPGFENHPYNIAVKSMLYGVYSQYDSLDALSYVAKFEQGAEKFIELYSHHDIWNNWQGFGQTERDDNHLIMGCVFLMMLLQGIPQLGVAGGVAETRFYYEEMRIKALVSAKMPVHWANVKMTNVGGPERKLFITRNSL